VSRSRIVITKTLKIPISSCLLRRVDVSVCSFMDRGRVGSMLEVATCLALGSVLFFEDGQPSIQNMSTTLSNGYLGSRNDEERSEMRYVMRIAEFSESSNL
jgi:hypothetical protein